MAQAAIAAQAFGTPCEDKSDASDDSCSSEDDDEQALTDAVHQCSVTDGTAARQSVPSAAQPEAGDAGDGASSAVASALYVDVT